MKKLLIGLVLSVAVSAPAFAEESDCEMIEKMSVLIMKSRQSGVSLTDAMDAMEISGDHEFLKDVVMDAYSQPAMRTPTRAHHQRNEFGAKWMLFCLKNT